MVEPSKTDSATTSLNAVVGRFAPSPSGRMHLGNIYAALMSWLSVKSRNGKWILRIEDLDPQRSRPEYAKMIEDDLLWLGLQWDEGGLEGKGHAGPYVQSLRSDIYQRHFDKLAENGIVYPCSCTRADIMSTQAPHLSDGRVVYSGRCRPDHLPVTFNPIDFDGKAARIAVGDCDIEFDDMIAGHQCYNLARDCGDFIIRRKDGAWAYQLAVVVDDALMGVTEVMRGEDLLLSAAQQIYLYRLLGYTPPRFAHLPLLCNGQGQRLSKRDGAMSMEVLRKDFSREALLGHIAHISGLTPSAQAISLDELLLHYEQRNNIAANVAK